MNEKHCSCCDIKKSKNNFYKMRSARDGLNPICKECHKFRYRYKPRPKKAKKIILIGKTKKCPSCNKTKDYAHYHVDRNKANGRVASCKDCSNAYKKNKYDNDLAYKKRKLKYSKQKETLLKNNITTALHYKHCKLCEEIFVISLHRGDPGPSLQQSFCSKECGYKNQVINQVKRQSKKLKEDPVYNINSRMRTRIWATLKRNNKITSATKIVKNLPYSALELKQHLEKNFKKGMTWDKFLNGEIHIDHVIPLALFNIDSEESEDFKRAWSLNNLQPLWAKENIKKGAKITKAHQTKFSYA